jgi:hypothetical protein
MLCNNKPNRGRCLDATAHRLVFYADDLGTDLRWLPFCSPSNESRDSHAEIGGISTDFSITNPSRR